MRRIVLFTVFLLALAAIPRGSASAVSANPGACSAGQCDLTFSYTGDYYAWTVPYTTEYTLQAWGASGGGGIAATSGGGADAYGVGGAGGYSSGKKTLTAGTILYIYVGQKGYLTTSESFNGGGGGNVSATGLYLGGFSGGGATHIATSAGLLSSLSTNQSAVLIVAGGGGAGAGGSAAGWEVYAKAGGAGGGAVGLQGQTNAGGGGTQIAGGTSIATPVTASGFGRGATATSATGNHISGGGGGGGWYGGGAGADNGGAGGGGSSYIDSLTAATTIAGNASMPDPAGGTTIGRVGNGIVKISYQVSIDTTTTISIAGNQTTLTYNSPVDISAAISTAGRVTFYANGKRIPKCISIQASSTAICRYSPSVKGTIAISASLNPSSNGYKASDSPKILVSVARRSGNR